MHALNAAGASCHFVEIETRPRPRRLPARRARAVRRRPRLPRCARRAARGSAGWRASAPVRMTRVPRRAAQRLDLLLVADLVAPGSRVLDVGCGDGALLALLRDAQGVDGRGIELSREASTNASPGACRSSRATPTATSPLPRRRLRLRHPVADAAGDAQAARRARAPAAHRPARDRLLPEFRPLADAAASCWPARPHAGDRGTCPIPGTTRPTSISARSATSSPCAERRRQDGARDRARCQRPADRVNVPWWFWNLFGEQAVFLLRRGAPVAERT